MTTPTSSQNPDVTRFLNSSDHPYRKEIDALRQILLSSNFNLEEGLKWNSPNYSHQGNDRITMRMVPSKFVQLVFHRGAKKQRKLQKRLIDEGTGTLLLWKENDRATTNFKSFAEIEAQQKELTEIISRWIEATK